MKFKFSKKNLPFYFITLLGIALLTYTSVRAGILSFTHDESLTYLRYVPKKFIQIVNYHSPSANNHIINTLLVKYIVQLFPEKEIFIRIPNLLAHASYIIFSVLIVKQFKNPFVFIGGFILINFNPYMLDFFSLSRGYGLALAFMLASIYSFFKYLKSNQKKYIYWYYILAAFAVLSNFVYLHYFVTTIIVFNLLIISELPVEKISFKTISKENIPALIVSIILTIILFEPIRKLTKFNELYGQGQKGFFSDTVISFINGTNYGQSYGQPYVKGISIVVMILCALIFIAVSVELIQKKLRIKHSTQSIFFLFLILPALSSIMQHLILNDQLLTYRLTLIFVPLLGLSIISFCDYLKSYTWGKMASFFLLAVSAIMLIHTIKSANFLYYNDWKYDANTKNMILKLEKEVPKESKSNTIKLGIKWLFEPTINFYKETKNLDWLEKVNREGVDGDYDYYYILKDQLPELNHVEIIKEYNISNTLFLEEK